RAREIELQRALAAVIAEHLRRQGGGVDENHELEHVIEAVEADAGEVVGRQDRQQPNDDECWHIGQRIEDERQDLRSPALLDPQPALDRVDDQATNGVRAPQPRSIVMLVAAVEYLAVWLRGGLGSCPWLARHRSAPSRDRGRFDRGGIQTADGANVDVLERQLAWLERPQRGAGLDDGVADRVVVSVRLRRDDEL